MQNFKFLLLFFLFPLLLFGQQKYTISGYVEDATSSEKLLSAAVVETEKRLGITTNTYGFFSLTLPAGQVSVQTSFVGYDNQIQSFLLRGDTLLTIRLSPIASLQTVEVSATRSNRVENQVQMSQISIPVAQIKRVPVILGETDILKVLQLTSGVKFGAEGTSGIYVRGGSLDQNLILLDGVPVYNAAHVGGLFSVFNADVIKNVTLTKGGFPARYGGRLSSILEIDMKEGNMNEIHGEGSIGLISSKFMLEGPLIKQKASFMVSARRTYADLVARPLLKNAFGGGDLEKFKLYFYDLNVKTNYIVNDRNRLFLSVYNGFDNYLNQTKQQSSNRQGGLDRSITSFYWGNLTTAFRWNTLISNKLFANTTLTYSQYKLNLLNRTESKSTSQARLDIYQQLYKSQIFDWGGRTDFDYIPNAAHHVRFGGGGTYHTFVPGALQLTAIEQTAKDSTLGGQRTTAFEPFLYAEDEWRINKMTLNLGIHLTSFFVNKTIYPSVQPRLNVLYSLPNSTALKASFCTMTQFINLLTNDGLGIPTDLWVPATNRVKPQQSWQAAVGVAKTIKDKYELSIEAYYKEMKNVISYREGADFLGQETNWEDKVVQGKGESYGLEVFFQKKTGKTTGWIGYTLSWNNRQFADINRGNPFPFKYDRRHDFSIVVAHQLTRKINLSANWIFATGNAITVPVRLYRFPIIDPITRQSVGSELISEYGDRNAFRTKNFHRLDIGLEFYRKRSKYERKWLCGFYNAYNRGNPFYALIGGGGFQSAGSVNIKISQFSLIPIIPYVSYDLRF